MTPLEQIIHDTLEQKDTLPVAARDVYMVMGKVQEQWKTIIVKTDDVNHARRTMYAAQIHGTFSHIVLCKSREIEGISTLRWKTLECALPIKAHIMAPSMDMQHILQRMKQNPANKNNFGSIDRQGLIRKKIEPNAAVKEREIANLPLSLTIVGAVLSMQLLPFMAAVMLVFFDWLYVEEKIDTLLDGNALSFFIRYRPLIYFVISLSVLIPAIVATFANPMLS